MEPGAPAWRVAAASVAGTAHLARGLPCQDAHALRQLPAGGLALVVADGAGSAPESETGAALAVAAAAEALQLGFGSGLAAAGPDPLAEAGARMRAVFEAARAAIEERANEAWEPLSRFACTLTCAVAGDSGLVVGQVGDGIAVARRPDGTLLAASLPAKGEYANETAFITQAGALDQLELRLLAGPFDALALSTDGLLRLALRLPDHSPHPPFFEPLFRLVAAEAATERASAALATLLASERIGARTDDDKTLVVAVRRP